jgi:hypothetical protein
MKYPLLRLCLRGGVVGSVLVFGCSQGPNPGTPGPVPVAALSPPSALPSPSTPVADSKPPRRPEVKILEVVPADGPFEEQEVIAGSPAPSVPPVVVRGAREETATAAAPYGHAPDYRWLTGELRYSPARGAWCLHYAGGEEDDRHGGSVTLVGIGSTTHLRAGQAVRVEGEMIDIGSREPSPPYRVTSLRPLPRG